MFSIADNLKSVRQRIQKATKSAGRTEDAVSLLSVSKTRSAETLKEAMTCGLTQFGENYLNEAITKQAQLAELITPPEFASLEWHFIGPIQSNKTRPIAEHFDWVQSIDREKIAQRLNDQRPPDKPPLNVCIQVNINDEETKSGIPLAHLSALTDAILNLPHLKLRGLMAIPKADQTEEELRQSFDTLQQAFETLKQNISSVDTLSIGMSSDIESAILHGSTMVRVGTALFGPRPPKEEKH